MVDVPVCPTNYDDDVPATDDRFGVHGRIAGTIEQVIEQTPGGKTIGLSGTWGSGKSTVVRLLQKAYEGRTASRVIWTFDAWAHEGDPLRRTFVESLVQTLSEKGWLASEWTDTIEFLSKRRRVTERRTASRLTPLGVLLPVAVLLAPIGTAVFSNQLRSGITLDASLPPDWFAIIGLVLMLAPIVTVGAWMLWVVTTGRARQGGLRSQLLATLTTFTQRGGDTDSRVVTRESGDPTSLEFEREFARLMTEALGAHPERRLVLVVDNLDRVGATQALAVWSTLQTFLQRRGSGEWIDRLWCLLPFDADAIRRLWQKENAPGNTVAESFLDKTFQLRFEVPLPRLANWKDYLVSSLGRALPEHTTTDEFFRIYRLSSVRRTADWVAPTPRQMKLFVNQIGALHRQWQHEIPLPDLAYYVLLRSEGVPIVPQLLAGELPAPAEAGLVSDRVRQSLAALVYGSEVEESHELLLRQPILDALERGDSSRLDELSLVSDKFWLVMDLAVEQGCIEWPRAEGGLVLHAVAGLDGMGKESRGSPWRVDALIPRLARAVRATQEWAPMDAKAIDGAIVVNRYDPSLGPLMYAGFTNLRFVQPVTMTRLQARAFAEEYVRLWRGLGSIRPSSQLATADVATYIEVAGALAAFDVEGGTWAHFVPANGESFVTGLSGREPSPGWADVVRVAAAGGVSNWNELIARAKEGLSAADGFTSAHRREMLAAIHVLTALGNPEATKILDDLTDAFGAAVHHNREPERALEWALAAIGPPAEDGTIAAAADPDALGAWLYTLLVRHGSSASVWESRRGLESHLETARLWLLGQFTTAAPELCESLARAAAAFGDAQSLFKVAHKEAEGFTSHHDRVVMARVLEAMAEMGVPPRVFPPRLVIDAWDASFPGWTRYELVNAMRFRRPEITDVLLSVPADSRLASAYAGALDAHRSGDDALATMCASYLPQATADDWKASLHGGEMGLPRLHAALARRGVDVVLPAAVRLVVRDYVTRPPSDVSVSPSIAAAIMGALGDEREEVLDRIARTFAALAESRSFVEIPQATLSEARLLAAFAGGALLEAERLRTHPRLFAAVAGYVIAASVHEWVAPLTEAVRANPALLQSLFPEERASLILLAERQSKSASESSRASLATLAEALTISVPSPGFQAT